MISTTRRCPSAPATGHGWSKPVWQNDQPVM
jgi:hypothetical protein